MKTMKIFGALMLSLALYAFSSSNNQPASSLGILVKDFSLINTDKSIVSLHNYKNAKGFIVIFTCNHCPFAKLYSQRLNDLNTKYKALGVPLLAINSMDATIYEEESLNDMKKKAKTDKFNFPYLADTSQAVGKNFGAEHTPQAFVIWKVDSQWIIKYTGAIDDNGEHPELAHSFIAHAVDELLKNQQVSMPETASFGCKIFYKNQ